MNHTVSRFLAGIAVVGFTGCATDVAHVNVGSGSRDALVALAGGAPQDRYLRVQSTKDNKPGRMAMVVPCDLWGPFRFEVSGGLYDSAKAAAADQAIFGAEVDGRGVWPPVEYYGISAQVTNGGLNVYAYTHNSAVPIGSSFFAGVTEIDLAIDYDGADFRFLARASGGRAYSEIATFALASQPNPLLPSVGVFNLSGKGVVGFDRWRIVQNGAEPGTPPAGHVAARKIWDAVSALVEAQHALDGFTDWNEAGTWLDTATTRMDEARTEVDGLTAGARRRKAKKLLKQAAAALEEAAALVAAEKKAGVAIDELEAAARKCWKAAKKAYDAS